MSRKVYISTGTSRKTLQLYLGVGNVARRVRSAYIGVDGSARKFWPVYHIWYRYSVSYTTVYSIYWNRYLSNGVNNVMAYYYTVCTGFTLNQDGTFTLSGQTTTRYNYGTRYATAVTISNSCIEYVNGPAGTYSISQPVYRVYLHSTSFNVSTAARGEISTSQGSAQQGSYIDQVTDENRTAYPDNGQSGSYWYVYQGEA